MEDNEYEEYKGFKIVCLNCGSENCTLNYDYDYDYDDNLVLNGYYYNCPKCGQSDR